MPRKHKPSFLQLKLLRELKYGGWKVPGCGTSSQTVLSLEKREYIQTRPPEKYWRSWRYGGSKEYGRECKITAAGKRAMRGVKR